ncbi:MAG: glycosyltransferase family 4 protein, partial [Eubacterium sp.]
PDIKDDSLIKEKYKIEKDGYILFLGRIVPEKGVHYLINAYKNISTDKKLVIAGGSSHTGEYMNEVKKLAGNDDRIIFTDFIQGEALEELYSNAYIYCLPSDLEGMPLSLLEAMSYGNCCLTSDIPECTEVCGSNAVSFEKGNEKDLQKKLQMLLDNKEITDKYKQCSADFICNKFNWSDIVSKTLMLYKGE